MFRLTDADRSPLSHTPRKLKVVYGNAYVFMHGRGFKHVDGVDELLKKLRLSLVLKTFFVPCFGTKVSF